MGIDVNNSQAAVGSGSHDLVDFMRGVSLEMAREYERIQKRAAEDPGTAGDQGEENWATLLRNWLPSAYKVVTKGRILCLDGFASPQVDVLVLHPSYPIALLDKKLYLAGGVAAAFECKITLRREHLYRAMETAAAIRRHLAPRFGTPYRELHSTIIYGLLAHSHSWRGRKPTPTKVITDHLRSADLQMVKHPREMLDLVCVANLGAWSSFKVAWLGPAYLPGLSENAKPLHGPDGSALMFYSCHSSEREDQSSAFTPIGATITTLLGKLAWQDSNVRELAGYFTGVDLLGKGIADGRPWSVDIYSEQIKPRVIHGPLFNGGPNMDEWCMVFT